MNRNRNINLSFDVLSIIYSLCSPISRLKMRSTCKKLHAINTNSELRKEIANMNFLGATTTYFFTDIPVGCHKSLTISLCDNNNKYVDICSDKMSWFPAIDNYYYFSIPNILCKKFHISCEFRGWDQCLSDLEINRCKNIDNYAKIYCAEEFTPSNVLNLSPVNIDNFTCYDLNFTTYETNYGRTRKLPILYKYIMCHGPLIYS